MSKWGTERYDDTPKDRLHRASILGFGVATLATLAAFCLFLLGADWWANQAVGVAAVFGCAALLVWATT